MLLKKLEESVAVITGASSGIGRATALELAERGTTVVLAARREAALREVAEECRRLGIRADVIPSDVSDENAVRELARRAIEPSAKAASAIAISRSSTAISAPRGTMTCVSGSQKPSPSCAGGGVPTSARSRRPTSPTAARSTRSNVSRGL